METLFEIDQKVEKGRAIRQMLTTLWKLLFGKIEIMHVWIYHDYFEDDLPHNWFSVEWEDK